MGEGDIWFVSSPREVVDGGGGLTGKVLSKRRSCVACQDGHAVGQRRNRTASKAGCKSRRRWLRSIT